MQEKQELLFQKVLMRSMLRLKRHVTGIHQVNTDNV